MSQAQDSLVWSPLSMTSSPAVAPSGTRAMTQRIGADDHRRAHFADGDARAVRFGKALSANLQLAAGDRRRRRDLRDLGLGIGGFPESHI